MLSNKFHLFNPNNHFLLCRQTPIRPQQDRFTAALPYPRAQLGSMIRMSQRQATVGVMTKNTSLQLWCMYLSGGAYLLMRTESDYCSLWSLADLRPGCLPARFLFYLPGINESCSTNLLPNQFCASSLYAYVREMVNSVIISLSIYADVL